VGETSLTVGAWPGAAVGDDVAVFGPGTFGESSVTTLAEAIGTVGEEIIVRVSPLVPRRYV
jgi:alanine racemase